MLYVEVWIVQQRLSAVEDIFNEKYNLDKIVLGSRLARYYGSTNRVMKIRVIRGLKFIKYKI